MQAIKQIRRRWVVGLVAFLLAGEGWAITISMEYTDEGDTPPHPENPSWDPDGSILKAHFNAAKAIWEQLLPGGGEYSFDFHWDNDIGSLGLYTPGVDEFIEINPDYDWFADPNPLDDVEFNAGVQGRYSGLSASDQSMFFPGTAPPGGLEVSYRGTGMPNGTLVNGVAVSTLSASGQILPGTMTLVDSSNGFDLLSVVLHEIGHALGIEGTEPGDYNIDPRHVGGLTNVLVLDHPDSGHLGGNAVTPGFLMNPGTPRGQRVYATGADVLVIAEDQGITVVQLARVGSVANGVWSDANNWIGGDVPDATQAVYLAHGGTVTLDVDGVTSGLSIAPGNTLAAGVRRFTTAGTLNFTGASLSVAPDGSIVANALTGDASGLTTSAGSLVRFNQFAGNTASTASFNGSLAIGMFMGSQDAPIVYDPSTLATPIATWTIGQDLRVGDEKDATLIVRNSTWNVGGNLVVGSGRARVEIGTGGALAVGGDVDVRGSADSDSDLIVGSTTTFTVAGRVNARPGGRITYGPDVAAPVRPHDVSGGATVLYTPPLPDIPFLRTSRGGSVTFENGARAGDASFVVDGGSGDAGPGGSVTFQGSSRAETADFRTKGGRRGPTLPVGFDVAGRGGVVRFQDSSTAGTAEFDNEGGAEYFAGTGGATVFAGSATAEGAIIRNHGATFVNGAGGETHFTDNAKAGPANGASTATTTIINFADGTSNAIGSAARTVFSGVSSAGTATIENHAAPGQGAISGRTEFRGGSTAAAARIHNRGFTTPGGLAGRTDFFDDSTAGVASIQLYEGYSDSGRVEFHDRSKAGFANIAVNNVASIVGSSGNGGHVIFHDTSSAEDARITLRENACCNGVQFYDHTAAARAVVVQEDRSGNIAFWENSTADHASFLVGRSAGVAFYDQSRAADGYFALADQARLTFAGTSAERAGIYADGGSFYTAASGALISFLGATATAADASISLDGGRASLASAPVLSFTAGAHAGNATIIARGGTNGGAGAEVWFDSGAKGDTARIVTTAGAVVDFRSQNTFGGTSLGSIEGDGTFNLRGSELTTGSRNTSTTVSGPITDGGFTGGRLTKVGAGTLTLAGVNTYNGVTTVNGGTVSVTGSIAGGAIVNSSGTLQGTGAIGGGVIVNAGGVFAPGLSPGTIAIGGLTMSPGSALNFEIGALARDRIVLTNSGMIALGGTLNVTLAGGFEPSVGQTFPLFEGSIGGISGAFSSINAPIFNGLTFAPLQNANALMLQVVDSTTLAADFNVDGTVSGADLTTWTSGFGASGSATHAQGDADGDADVDGADFLVWQRQLGLPALGTAAHAAVPEPGTGILLPMAGIWLLACRAASQSRMRAVNAV